MTISTKFFCIYGNCNVTNSRFWFCSRNGMIDTMCGLPLYIAPEILDVINMIDRKDKN